MVSNEEKVGIKRITKSLLLLMKRYKLKFIFTGICAVLSVLFSVYSPILLGDAINILVEGAGNIANHTGTIDFGGLIYILTVASTLYFLSNLVSYIQTYYLTKTTSEIIYSLRNEMINKALHLPMKSVDENQRGDLISRLTNDIDVVEEAFLSSFIDLSTTIITIVGTLIMMLILNVWLTLAIVAIVLLSSGLIASLIKFSQRYFTKQMNIQGRTVGEIEEIFSNQEVIRSLNYETRAIDAFNSDVENWYTYEWKSSFISSLNTPIMNMNSNLGYVIISVLGSVFVLQGTMSIGRILTFLEYLKNFTDPIETITGIIPDLQAGTASLERIAEFLELDEEENSSKKELTEFSDEITFENISFAYTEDKKIIENFTLNVKKGEKVAIIGETGAGKTTLIKLLMRLYDVDSGEIKIDGININEYDKNSLRSFMGMVLQETWLFSDTIKDNILYGKLDATEEELFNAAKQANADDFIRKLPEGYDTILDEDGENISQGQKQLLTIARAIISQKEILILDEATSNIDTRTEELIQNALDKLMKNKTSFVIAHRLSTIQNADKILVLGQGRVIEQGTHEELLAQKGYYYNTLKTQEKSR